MWREGDRGKSSSYVFLGFIEKIVVLQKEYFSFFFGLNITEITFFVFLPPMI